jgi:hypothetical protein
MKIFSIFYENENFTTMFSQFMIQFKNLVKKQRRVKKINKLIKVTKKYKKNHLKVK